VISGFWVSCTASGRQGTGWGLVAGDYWGHVGIIGRQWHCHHWHHVAVITSGLVRGVGVIGLLVVLLCDVSIPGQDAGMESIKIDACQRYKSLVGVGVACGCCWKVQFVRCSTS